MEFSDLSSIKKDEVGIVRENEQHVYTNTLIAHIDSLPMENVDHDYETLRPSDQTLPKPKNGRNCDLILRFYKHHVAVLACALLVLLTAVAGLAIAIFVPKGDPVDGEWSIWTSWGQCSATCNIGMEHRNRTCSNPLPSKGGNACSGEPSEYRLCNWANCTVTHAQWSVWTAWSSCSANCMKSRTRTCLNPAPSKTELPCQGNSEDKEICNIDCILTQQSVNGGWSLWGSWGQCSATCNTGMEQRIRTCSNPSPSKGGNFCFGEPSEYRLCNRATCAVTNGQWSAWTVWSTCSANCMKSRTRTCTNPAPSQYGLLCQGNSEDKEVCNWVACIPAPSNGGWSVWSSWSSCSAICMKTRTRACTDPAPSQLGRMCQGNSEDKETCNSFSCVFKSVYVRLVAGTSSSNGRVEVSLDKWNWGTVCDDFFDAADAKVVCRMLGYSNATVLESESVVDGLGPIYLDNLSCIGNESSLLHCSHNGWGTHNCGHGEDVGVSCF